MADPSFARLAGGGYAYVLPDQQLRIEARYLRRSFGHLEAELDVRCAWAGVKHHHGSLSCGDVNLSSQAARTALAKHCMLRAKTKPTDFDWGGVIDATCLLVIQAERQGDEAIVLDDAPENPTRDLVIRGLTIPGDASAMFIAHGDGLKSMVLLLLLIEMAAQGRPVLFLDWEWSAERHRARKRRLFGTQRLDTLHYLRCRAPLTVEADRVRRYCDQHQIAHLGVDSIGLACDGKLSDDDTAIRFHRALATLPPALCAAHVAKSTLTADFKADPQAFGSVYFHNLCRMSWSVKKQPGLGENNVVVGLFPHKQNDGDRQQPVGLSFTFEPDTIMVESADLAAVEGLAEKLPLATRMIHLLTVKRSPMTYAEIAVALDAKVDSVIKAASRADAFTKMLNCPDGIQRLALVEKRHTR